MTFHARTHLDIEYERLVFRILNLYYNHSLTQAVIARQLGLSVAKVNRLISAAREMGWVKISFNTPNQTLLDLEQKVTLATGVQDAVVIPRLSEDPESILANVGLAAAHYLQAHLRDNDVIAVGGGRGVAAMVKAIEPVNASGIQVVPALGGLQGRFSTDVNNLAAELAYHLAGRSFQLHAPAFTDNAEEREAIIQLRQVREVLERARKATIAVVGIGSVDPSDSSIWQFTNLTEQEIKDVAEKDHGVGEILARIYNNEGKPCAERYSYRVVGLELNDLRSIPLTIGIAALDHKTAAVRAAIQGKYIKTLITDEPIARELIDGEPIFPSSGASHAVSSH